MRLRSLVFPISILVLGTVGCGNSKNDSPTDSGTSDIGSTEVNGTETSNGGGDGAGSDSQSTDTNGTIDGAASDSFGTDGADSDGSPSLSGTSLWAYSSPAPKPYGSLEVFNDSATSVLPKNIGYVTTASLTPDGQTLAFARQSKPLNAILAKSGNSKEVLLGSVPSASVGSTSSVIIAMSPSPLGDRVAIEVGTCTSYANPSTCTVESVWLGRTATAGSLVKVSPGASSSGPSPTLWSADGKTLYFAGDFTTSGASQLYSVDTTAATLASKPLIGASTVGSKGLDKNQPLGFASASTLIFKAQMPSDSKPTLWTVHTDGTGLARFANVASGAGVGTIGFFADGSRIAFSSDSATANAYEVYSAPLATTAAPTPLTPGTFGAGFGPTSPLYVSPDGKLIAFVANTSSTST